MPLISYKDQIRLKKLLKCSDDIFREIDGVRKPRWFQIWRRADWAKRCEECREDMRGWLREAGLREDEF